ncbi:MAG: Putative amidase AmiC [Alphaproteobacteria bacterium]|nr:MAG: Putative amidase AmiC [Alphaproteobacteria bacterium]
MMQRRDFLAGASALALSTAIKPAYAAMDEFVAYDGMGQAELVRSGRVSSLELVEAAIKRIERLNPALNAVVHKMYDQGREAAKGDLPDGPFKGVPYLIKDLSELEGEPLTFGSKLFEHNVSDSDNGSVVRAKQAGLVIIGKTNTPEFGFVSTTESQLLGAARNPYNAAYHTGGSSGGAGAAVAAGMVPFAHASDGGGSIRIPASVNGLVGLKPTRQRLFMNTPPYSEADISTRLAVSRSVRDTAQILNVSEKKGSDANYPPTGFISGPAKKRLKIAMHTKAFDGREPHIDVKRSTERAAKLCADLGHKVELVDMKVVGSEFIDQFMNVWSSVAYELVNNARLIGLMQGRWVNPEEVLEPFSHGLAELYAGRKAKNPNIDADALAYVKSVEAGYRSFFEDYDVILSPTLFKPPLLLGEQGSDKSYDEIYASVMDYVTYTAQYNASGNPAISLPLYTSRDGLPIGTQFAAAHGEEAILLHLAYELEEALPWKNRWPEISAKKLS